MATKCSKNR